MVEGVLLIWYISIFLTFFFVVAPQADIILSAGECYEVVYIEKPVIIEIKMQE